MCVFWLYTMRSRCMVVSSFSHLATTFSFCVFHPKRGSNTVLLKWSTFEKSRLVDIRFCLKNRILWRNFFAWHPLTGNTCDLRLVVVVPQADGAPERMEGPRRKSTPARSKKSRGGTSYAKPSSFFSSAHRQSRDVLRPRGVLGELGRPTADGEFVCGAFVGGESAGGASARRRLLRAVRSSSVPVRPSK